MYFKVGPKNSSMGRSSFSKPYIASPMSQLILQHFRRFAYITAHSTTLLLLHLRHLASRPWTTVMCNMMFCKQMRLTYVILALLRDRLINKIKNGAKIIIWTAESNYEVVLKNRECCWSSTAMETWVQNRITNAINNCTHSWQVWDSWYRMRCSQGDLGSPRSQNLTPLDFYLWGTLKNVIDRRKPAILAAIRE